MLLVKTTKIEIKKSKFIGFLYKIVSFDEVDIILNELLKDNRKAAHICYGAILNSEVIFKNDNEVGNPGRQLLQLLELNKMDGYLLVVVRYFGGVKLGVGGVQRAVRDCGKECLDFN